MWSVSAHQDCLAGPGVPSLLLRAELLVPPLSPGDMFCTGWLLPLVPLGYRNLLPPRPFPLLLLLLLLVPAAVASAGEMGCWVLPV